MLKLLNTWRHPSPSSSFLPLSSSSSSASSSSTSTSSSAATTTSSRYIFPPSILTQLDSFVRSVPRPRHVILTESILNDLNTCIATKKTEHLYSTPDPQSLEQLSMLENLRTTIQSGQFPIETLELMKEKISSLSASMHLPSTSSSSSTTASISTTITSSANVNVSQIGLPLSTQTTLPPQLPTPPLPPSPSSSSSSSPLSSVASSTISATSISTATTSTSSTSSAIASFSPSTSSTSATVSPLPINSNTTSSSQVVFPSLPLFSTISSTLTASSSSTVHVPTHSVPLSSASSMMTINPPLVPLPLSSTTVPSSFSYFPLSSLASTINPTTTSLVTSPPTPPIVSPPSIPSLPTQTPPLVTSNTPTALLSLPLPSYPTTTTTTTTSTPSTSTPLTLLTPPPMLLSSGIVIPLPSTIPSFHQGLLRQKPTIQPPRPASISKDSSESSCHEPPVFEIEIHQSVFFLFFTLHLSSSPKIWVIQK
ncbi:hypothetical protein HMI56_003449 [Coelomomyces lativittatus]|nr:hypothetical protein HMI56_003449 [Coelomomyces lativittatus]